MQLPLPALHVVLVRVQSTQATPFFPQAVSSLPSRHALVASQQPGQWLVAQGVPHPSSAPTHFPLQSGTHWHVPLTQTSPAGVQSTQATPPVPQTVAVVPFWQVPALLQQPLQVLEGQGPPQPSSSP